METSYLIIIELIVVLGAIFGFGFWELYKLRRSREADRTNASADEYNEKKDE